MATLHLISNPDALASCLAVAGGDDSLVLLEDGVYAAASLAVSKQPSSPRFFAIAKDLTIRGLPAADSAISYEQMVALCAEHEPITSWC